MMNSMWRRFLGVALLPLLILVGPVGPGGWYCADGSQCEPWFAASCCCGCGATDCAGDGSESCRSEIDSPKVAAASCDCYYHAEAVASLVKSVPTAEHGTLLPSASASIVPRWRVVTCLPAPSLLPPDSLHSSPTDTRGPPAA
jgi:hypothetical protein